MNVVKKFMLYCVTISLAIYVFIITGGCLYSQQKITRTFNKKEIPEYLKVPKYAYDTPILDEFGLPDCISLYEIVMPPKPIPSKQQIYNTRLGYHYYECGIDRNYPVNYSVSYIGFYSIIHDKDIFPLPGALYCRIKSEPKVNYDAFLVQKKYYPEGKGITIGTDTLIIPYIPPQNDSSRRSYLFGYFSADVIEKDAKGELQVKITYIPKMDCQKPLENKVTVWYRTGDIIQFFKATNRDNPTNKPFVGANGMRLGYWPDTVKGESFGLRIVNIVPRDLYPMRIVGDNIKGRLIGWIELDQKIIPLDQNGKPIEQNH
jgi:hypothetical protein